MDINRITAGKISLNNKSAVRLEQQNKTADLSGQKTAEIPYYSYIANSNISFGNRREELSEFDVAMLPDARLDDEFDILEGISASGLNLSCLTNLSSQYMTEQIRAIENTGRLIPYKEAAVREEKKHCSEEEINACLEEEKKIFLEKFSEEQAEALKEIEKVNPTVKPHTVYRIINNYHNPDNESYFDRINALKSGDEIILDKSPLYVSTSPAGILKNYGSTQNGVLFQINIPKGSKLVKFPSMDGINQLLMKPEAKFIVKDNQEYKNNFRLITLDYINE